MCWHSGKIYFLNKNDKFHDYLDMKKWKILSKELKQLKTKANWHRKKRNFSNMLIK